MNDEPKYEEQKQAQQQKPTPTEHERKAPTYPEKIHGKSRRMKDWWRNRMHSPLIRMSRGAQNFWRSLPWAHKENWRRKNKKK